MDFGHTREKALRIRCDAVARVVRRAGVSNVDASVPTITAAMVPNPTTPAAVVKARLTLRSSICLLP